MYARFAQKPYPHDGFKLCGALIPGRQRSSMSAQVVITTPERLQEPSATFVESYFWIVACVLRSFQFLPVSFQYLVLVLYCFFYCFFASLMFHSVCLDCIDTAPFRVLWFLIFFFSASCRSPSTVLSAVSVFALTASIQRPFVCCGFQFFFSF